MSDHNQDARQEILAQIKKGKPAPHPLPELPHFEPKSFGVDDFIKKLLSFDGRCVRTKSREAALRWLASQPELETGKNQIFSTVPEFTGNFTDTDLTDLRNAHKIDSCVTEGLYGVAEMGSIYVTDTSLGHAACALLTKRLFVLLDTAKILGDMHDAYCTINLSQSQYGSYFTGPSATADIEAVHITGAQGPLALTAVLYNCADADEVPQLLINPAADKSIWAQNE